MLIVCLIVFAAFKVLFYSLTPLEMLFKLFQNILYYFAFLIGYNTVMVSVEAALVLITYLDYKTNQFEEEMMPLRADSNVDIVDTFNIKPLQS